MSSVDNDLLSFLASSPSPYHAVLSAIERLSVAGWTELDLTDDWSSVEGRHYVQTGGALIAWNLPAQTASHAGVRIIGAHTDSPNLRLKPRPDTGAAGWRQLGVEVYGGALVNSWLDRDLGISGRVVMADGSVRLVVVDEPIARVSQLAIHLDREVNDKGLLLDKQQHLTPVWGIGTPTDGEFLTWLAANIGFDSTAVVSHDLMFHDLTAPAYLGRDRELLASARLDNLCSCWCAITALADPAAQRSFAIVSLFDHEEVGSTSTSGADSPLLQQIISRLVEARGGTASHLARALHQSFCVSADMAHAVHPNYGERHEPAHRPLPNGGPVIKVNANQRYATDAISHAMFARACNEAGVPHQVFVSRNNMPCGSTIGPITAGRLGIPTVDVGCAQLSMHSARELCGADDPGLMVKALNAFLVQS